MQNSQRVLLAKPRTAVASRHGRRRGGASREARRPSIAPYRNGARAVRTAMERGRCARMRAGVRCGARGTDQVFSGVESAAEIDLFTMAQTQESDQTFTAVSTISIIV